MKKEEGKDPPKAMAVYEETDTGYFIDQDDTLRTWNN